MNHHGFLYELSQCRLLMSADCVATQLVETSLILKMFHILCRSSCKTLGHPDRRIKTAPQVFAPLSCRAVCALCFFQDITQGTVLITATRS